MTTRTIKTALAGIAVFMLIATAMPVASDHYGEPDREATYIGTGGLDHGLNEYWVPACEIIFGAYDCPLTIPSGIFWSSCHDESWLGLVPFQGIGGVLFCNIPNDAAFAVAVHDDMIDPAVAHVYCLGNKEQGRVLMGKLEGHGAFDLEDDCPVEPKNHPNDDPGTTRVTVYFMAPEGIVTTGRVTLNFL